MKGFYLQLISSIILGLTASFTTAQTIYGNEWINNGQTYIRIPIIQSGFYKLTFQQLSHLGIIVDTISTNHLQLYRNGQQVAFDLRYDSIDIKQTALIFYAQSNDGVSDSSLYINPKAIPQRYYNLYSDTASYYITWNQAGNSRIQAKIQTEYTAECTTKYIEEEIQIFNSHYSTGSFYPPGSNFQTGMAMSSYDEGEGWTGPLLTSKNTGRFQIKLQQPIIDQISLHPSQIHLLGQDIGNHEFDIWVNKNNERVRKILTSSISNYNNKIIDLFFQETDIQLDHTIQLEIIPIDLSKFSISSINWYYPRLQSNNSTLTQKAYTLDHSYKGKCWRHISSAANELFDCTNPYSVQKIKYPELGFVIEEPLYLIEVKEYLIPENLEIIKFKNINPTEIDYLIISHQKLRTIFNDPVNAYADYRASPSGGNYKPFVMNSHDINHQFNYGQPGPNGIRKLIQWLHKKGNLKYAFIIGSSIDPQTNRKQAINRDLVPNAGWPGSDLALAMPVGKGVEDFIPRVPIGRINAELPHQVFNYLKKVIEFESAPSQEPWRKKILHLGGGSTQYERDLFRRNLDILGAKVKSSTLAPHITTFSKKTDDPIENIPISKYLSIGTALITLFGHSGTETTDLNIGFASDSLHITPHNPYYPVIIANGCATGSIFYSTKTLSSDWIFAPNSGAILFLAHTFNGISSNLNRYTKSIYDVLADSTCSHLPFGDIQKEAIKRNLSSHFSLGDAIHAQQMNLQGDPAIRIFPSKLPDYTFDKTFPLQSQTLEPDSISFTMVIQNNGRAFNDTLLLALDIDVEGYPHQKYQFKCPKIAHADTLTFRILHNYNAKKPESWTFTLDPTNKIREENKENNSLQYTFIPQLSEALPLLPLNATILPSNEINFVAQIPKNRVGETLVLEWANNDQFNAPTKQYITTRSQIIHIPIVVTTSDLIFWRVNLENDTISKPAYRYLHIDKQTHYLHLPEVIILASDTVKNVLIEGENFHGSMIFQNITDQPFLDSIQVIIQHRFEGKEYIETKWITPISGLEKRVFDFRFPSTGQTGLHEISVFFNSDYNPELIYENNIIVFTFEVLPDQSAPIILVKVDNKYISNVESVSSRPKIDILILDENTFQIRKDTTDIYIHLQKVCENCPSKRIFFKDAKTTYDVEGSFSINLQLPELLTEGTYLLTVDAQDLSKNKAKTHRSKFTVTPNKNIQINASPNPSKSWFRFTIELSGQNSINGKIRITNIKGQIVQEFQHTYTIGKNEIFWKPENLPTGIYVYELIIMNSHQNDNISPPKGKLIWIP